MKLDCYILHHGISTRAFLCVGASCLLQVKLPWHETTAMLRFYGEVAVDPFGRVDATLWGTFEFIRVVTKLNHTDLCERAPTIRLYRRLREVQNHRVEYWWFVIAVIYGWTDAWNKAQTRRCPHASTIRFVVESTSLAGASRVLDNCDCCESVVSHRSNNFKHSEVPFEYADSVRNYKDASRSSWLYTHALLECGMLSLPVYPRASLREGKTDSRESYQGCDSSRFSELLLQRVSRWILGRPRHYTHFSRLRPHAMIAQPLQLHWQDGHSTISRGAGVWS